MNLCDTLDSLEPSGFEGDAAPPSTLACDMSARGGYPSDDVFGVGRCQMRGA